MPEPPTWMSSVAHVLAVPAMAMLWWALGFLAWQTSGLSTVFESLRPTLPVLLSDLGVAIFGPLGASLVVIALLRRWGLSVLSVLLGFLIPAALTLTRGLSLLGFLPPAPFYVNPSERTIMLVVTAVAAAAGLGIGAFAVGSLQRLGFLGLLAVSPVVSMLSVLLLDPRSDLRWLTCAALVVLLVMIAWRRWSAVLLWPVFFVLYWMLTLTMTAVSNGAQTLRHRGGGVSVGFVAEAMLGVVRSAWRVLLGLSWGTFWPAAVIAGLVIVGQYAWRRTAPSDS
jgi:hypothetical protein